MNEHNTSSEVVQGKESYETQKAEKQQMKESGRKNLDSKRNIRKIGTFLLLFAVVVIVGFGLVKFFESQGAKGEDFSRAVSVMGRGHISVGSALPQYTSNPPSSGPHYGQTARTGFREEEIRDQNIIHNLEHGDIWIAYHPRISEDLKSQLKKFGASKVIVTPRRTNDTDIALVAWGRIDDFNIENGILDQQRIKDFIRRYTNLGPERVGPHTGGI